MVHSCNLYTQGRGGGVGKGSCFQQTNSRLKHGTVAALSRVLMLGTYEGLEDRCAHEQTQVALNTIFSSTPKSKNASGLFEHIFAGNPSSF